VRRIESDSPSRVSSEGEGGEGWRVRIESPPSRVSSEGEGGEGWRVRIESSPSRVSSEREGRVDVWLL
jgi:hypothetical protein